MTKKNGGVRTRIISVALYPLRCGMRLLAAFPWPRRVLNAVYVKLTPFQRNLFYKAFAKIFRNSDLQGRGGSWNVIFADKPILMPLTSERFWLDWDTAVSIVGNDIEVKEAYEALICSPERPELFIDIGANYGTHSLLFLVHQIKTLTFEPNSSCHSYFMGLCKLNHVTPNLEPVALGEEKGYAVLSYPERDAWLGSTNAEVAKNLALTQELTTETVEQKTLDDYLAQIGQKRTLIKIDTEGNELSVLRGATRILRENRPKIIFECWNDGQRTHLFDFFNSLDYRICPGFWNPTDEVQPLTQTQFMASPATNYIAVPV